MRVAQCLQHPQFVVDHLFIAFNTFFENDLDSTFVSLILGFPHDSVGPGSEGLSEPILGFLIIAIRLALQLA